MGKAGKQVLEGNQQGEMMLLVTSDFQEQCCPSALLKGSVPHSREEFALEAVSVGSTLSWADRVLWVWGLSPSPPLCHCSSPLPTAEGIFHQDERDEIN